MHKDCREKDVEARPVTVNENKNSGRSSSVWHLQYSVSRVVPTTSLSVGPLSQRIRARFSWTSAAPSCVSNSCSESQSSTWGSSRTFTYLSFTSRRISVGLSSASAVASRTSRISKTYGVSIRATRERHGYHLKVASQRLLRLLRTFQKIRSRPVVANRKKNIPRGCIFCTRHGDLSKEHFWSDWIAALLPDLDPSPAHIEFVSVHTMKSVPVSHKTMSRQGSAITKKLRVVCRGCNHGWMKAIEEAARPMLAPMITGVPIVLDRDQQRIVAEWITLKMMVAEHNIPGEVIVPQADRDKFFADRTIPSYFRIWVIASASEKWRSRYIRHNTTFMLPTVGSPPPTVKRNTQTIAWGIGRVFIYVMMSTAEGLDLQELVCIHPLVLKLFPYSGSTLPAPFVWTLNDAACDKMAATLDTLIQSPRVIYKDRPKGTPNG